MQGTKRDAERLLRQRQLEVETGSYVERSSITVAEYVKEWLDTYGRTNIREVTRDGYLKKLRPHVLPAIGGLQLRLVRPHHLSAIYGEMAQKNRAAQTILHVHRAVHVVLSEAVKTGLLAANPASRVTPPKVRSNGPAVWGLDDVQSFLTATRDHPFREYYRVMVYTGLRPARWPGSGGAR